MALAILTAILLQPRLRKEEDVTLRPQIVVLADDTESMTDSVDPAQESRAARIREWLRSSALADAGHDFDIRYFSFSDHPVESADHLANMKFQGKASDITDSVTELEGLITGQPVAGILLLSDGLDTTDSPPVVAMETAGSRSRCTPLNSRSPFSDNPPHENLSIGGVDYPPRAFVNRDVDITAKLSAEGMNGQTVPVELWSEGRKIDQNRHNLHRRQRDKIRPLYSVRRRARHAAIRASRF